MKKEAMGGRMRCPLKYYSGQGPLNKGPLPRPPVAHLVADGDHLLLLVDLDLKGRREGGGDKREGEE